MREELLLKISSETYTKSTRTRRRFLRLLRRNIRLALRDLDPEASIDDTRWSRILIRTKGLDAAMERLSRVFGIHSVARVQILNFDPDSLADLIEKVTPLCLPRVKDKIFVVRAKRSGTHPFNSAELERELGSVLFPFSAGVSLKSPECVVELDIHHDQAHVVVDSVAGASGMPLGSGGRALALFSGGFDSPVACWMAMNRGLDLELVVCDLGGLAQERTALEVAQQLVEHWAPGRQVRIHVLNFVPVVLTLTQSAPSTLRQVLLKRAMYRAGELLAKELGVEVLLTGEALNQASSQTLRNLAIAEQAVSLPVIRPLIALSKNEIISRARRIGTHEVSQRVKEFCDISAGRVETRARLRDVERAEERTAEFGLAELVAGRKEISLKNWQPVPDCEVTTAALPSDAVVVDLREQTSQSGVVDLCLPFSQFERWSRTLDKSRAYLFVCAMGDRSALVARELVARGFRAKGLAGGIARLPAERTKPGAGTGSSAGVPRSEYGASFKHKQLGN